jgi:hypothetical protein
MDEVGFLPDSAGSPTKLGVGLPNSLSPLKLKETKPKASI